jgi:hypothetical protein
MFVGVWGLVYVRAERCVCPRRYMAAVGAVAVFGIHLVRMGSSLYSGVFLAGSQEYVAKVRVALSAADVTNGIWGHTYTRTHTQKKKNT